MSLQADMGSSSLRGGVMLGRRACHSSSSMNTASVVPWLLVSTSALFLLVSSQRRGRLGGTVG